MKSRSDYMNKWQKENRERINLLVDKGKKEEIKSHAAGRGESVNGFINRAIDETIANDNAERG